MKVGSSLPAAGIWVAAVVIAAPELACLPDRLPTVAWPAGDWRMTSRPLQVEEFWLPPGGAPPTDFKLTSDSPVLPREAVFENPAHDFPKRITYTRNPDGSVTARVDGGPGSLGEGGAAEVFSYTPMR